MLFYQIQNDIGVRSMEANLHAGSESIHVADFYLRGVPERHIFTFDLHADSLVEVCKQVESRLVLTGLISTEQFADWLNLLGLYLARHGLYIESGTLRR